ncbi:MAG: YaiI/YqxD family protein [Gemmatimonadota bacterium]|nr:MAG: YaiI/YqxD family protein [Gemmatimonadota bacterium]
MRLWVDADAAPRDVKEIVFRSALRLQIDAVLVANQRLQVPANNRFATSIRVDGGPDKADDYIADHAIPGDVAVTADIPLAARLVEKGVLTLDPRGTEYSEDNIGERLSIRDFMEQVRMTGVETGGPRAYGPKDKQSFANALDRVLTRLARSRVQSTPRDAG